MNHLKIIPICQGCKKKANEIQEYIESSDELNMHPYDYVREEEGTYNHENGHFLCTDCYIAAGMPAKPYPEKWICP